MEELQNEAQPDDASLEHFYDMEAADTVGELIIYHDLPGEETEDEWIQSDTYMDRADMQ